MKKILKITINLEVENPNGEIQQEDVDEFYKSMKFEFTETKTFKITKRSFRPKIELFDTPEP